MCLNSSLFWDSLTLSCYLIYNYHIMSTLYSHIISQIYWWGRFRDFKNVQQLFLSYFCFTKFGHSSARTETHIPRHKTLLLFSNIRSVLRELSWWRTYHTEVNKHSSSSSHHGEALNHFSPKQWAVVGREGRFGHNHLSSPPSSLPSPPAIILPVPRWNEKISVMSRS